MNTGWELGQGKRAGEKDLVDTGGGRAGWVMARLGNDRGEFDRGGGRGRGGGEVRWESAGGKTPGGDRLE